MNETSKVRFEVYQEIGEFLNGYLLKCHNDDESIDTEFTMEPFGKRHGTRQYVVELVPKKREEVVSK